MFELAKAAVILDSLTYKVDMLRDNKVRLTSDGQGMGFTCYNERFEWFDSKDLTVTIGIDEYVLLIQAQAIHQKNRPQAGELQA